MSSLTTNLTTTDRLESLLPQLFSQQQREGNYYLRFQLTDETEVLLDLRYVVESVTIDSSQITAVPNLPEYVVGLISSQNQVFLAIDLAHLAGFTPQTIDRRQYQTIVVRIEANSNVQAEFNFYGLTVKRILGISRILPQQIEESNTAAPELLRSFVRGLVRDEGQASFLLDLKELMTKRIK